MNPTEITSIISTVGFPIVVAGVLFWYVWELQKSHKEEMESMRKTIESNTNILTELKELIRGFVK